MYKNQVLALGAMVCLVGAAGMAQETSTSLPAQAL